ADACGRSLFRRAALEALGDFRRLGGREHAPDLVRREHGAAALVELMADREPGAGRDPAHGRAQARGRKRLALDDGDAEKPPVTFEAQPPHGRKKRFNAKPRENNARKVPAWRVATESES